jgi:hypothetical protein
VFVFPLVAERSGSGGGETSFRRREFSLAEVQRLSRRTFSPIRRKLEVRLLRRSSQRFRECARITSIMSWDIFVQDFPQEAKTVSDIPKDFRPRSLGERSAIIERIRAVVPASDFSDPSWGVIDGDGWSIEVNMGDEKECRSFAFHVRGGDGPVGVVEAILQDLGLRAVDSGTGDFFVGGSEALDSFRKWRAYRDQVAGENST